MPYKDWAENIQANVYIGVVNLSSLEFRKKLPIPASKMVYGREEYFAVFPSLNEAIDLIEKDCTVWIRDESLSRKRNEAITAFVRQNPVITNSYGVKIRLRVH